MVDVQTNAYHDFCQHRGVDTNRTEDHEGKTKVLGRTAYPEGGITNDDVYGVLGIVICMGLTKLPRMADHWKTDADHDYPEVRKCMGRDFFFLVYSRFLHFAPSIQKPDDRMHHFR